MQTNPDPTKPADTVRYSTINGRTVSAVVFRQLMAEGALEPCRDGLFGDSQTYRWSGE